MLRLKVKRLDPEAQLPTKNHEDDACFDIYMLDKIAQIPPHGIANVGTGVAFEVPPGYWMDIRPRSGLGFSGMSVHIGTLDAGYRGELRIAIFNHTDRMMVLHQGDRIAQMRLSEIIATTLIEVYELNDSKRGTKGFGSSGGGSVFQAKSTESS